MFASAVNGMWQKIAGIGTRPEQANGPGLPPCMQPNIALSAWQVSHVGLVIDVSVSSDLVQSM